MAPELIEALPDAHRLVNGRPRRRRFAPLSAEREAELVAMYATYLDGASAAEVGAAFGKSKQAVLAAFHTHGYVTRSRSRCPNPARILARVEAVTQRYDQGLSVALIARRLKLSPTHCYRLIRLGGRSPERDRRARQKAAQ